MTNTSTQHSSEVPLDLEVAFGNLKPLLFNALSKLARQGFVVPPQDGVDLIHDFLIDKLGGLKKRYEPNKGDFKNYVYAAFVRFARPRIMRLQRLQGSLVEPKDFEWLSRPLTDANFELSPDYQQPLAQAIKDLPPDEGSIFRTYISANVPSERLLAEGLGIPRYQVRELLVRALGRVVTQISRPPGITEHDWKVARALWRDQRTITETAAHLGLTSQQVRMARVRITKFLETSLRNMQPIRRFTRRIKMKGERYNIPARRLLGETLKATGDSDLLQQLRDRSEEVIASLGTNPPGLVEDDESLDLDPEWVAAVYEALGGDVEFTREDQALAEALFEASENDERAVGEAFRQVFWSDLPEELRNLERWFTEASRIDTNDMEALLQDPSVDGGLPESTLLLIYGITPMKLYLAMEAIASALDELQDSGIINDRSPIYLYSHEIEVKGVQQDIFNPESLIAEIYTYAKCDKATAQSLYLWLISVAQYKPHIFVGFESTPTSEGVQLHRIDEKYDDLFSRWRSVTINGRTEIEDGKQYAVTATSGQKSESANDLINFLSRPQEFEPLSLRHQIAVIPTSFDQLSEEYLQYGVTSSIVRSLSLLPDLTVKLPHHITFTREQAQNVNVIREIGQKLGVHAVLTGFIEPAERSFQYNPLLVSTNSEEIWRGQYNSSYAEIFRVGEDISRTLSSFLNIRHSVKQVELLSTLTTDDSEAQKLYMEGQYHWSRWTANGFRKAIGCYEKALKRDQVFSLALAGKADCYNMLTFVSSKVPGSTFTKAKAAAYDALEFNESLADAHASIGCAYMFYYWKWSEAESGFRRALKINPNYANARQWYSEYLTISGRFDEAIGQGEIAQILEPNSAIICAARGATYFFSKDYDLAIRQFEEALKNDPNLARARFGLAIVHAQIGLYNEAMDNLRDAVQRFPESTRGLAVLGYVSALSGNKDVANGILYTLLNKSEKQFISPYSLALIHMALRDQDSALERLEEALEYRDPSLTLLKVDPRFDEIRENHRFQDVITEVGLIG